MKLIAAVLIAMGIYFAMKLDAKKTDEEICSKRFPDKNPMGSYGWCFYDMEEVHNVEYEQGRRP